MDRPLSLERLIVRKLVAPQIWSAFVRAATQVGKCLATGCVASALVPKQCEPRLSQPRVETASGECPIVPVVTPGFLFETEIGDRVDKQDPA